MILSNCVNDFEVIKDTAHIEDVCRKITSKFPVQINDLRNSVSSVTADESVMKLFHGNVTITRSTYSISEEIYEYFEKRIEDFIEEQSVYKKLYCLENLKRIRKDKNKLFRQILKDQSPTIRKAFKAKSEVMKEWMTRFNSTEEEFFYETLADLVKFGEKYSLKMDRKKYYEFSSVKNFKFSKLEEEVGILGVIGSGIKSTILYYLFPDLFPKKGQNAMYALYFLTEFERFGLRSSEFVMIDDVKNMFSHGMRMSQNYWYPYDLFSFYSLNIYKLIERLILKTGKKPNPDYKYVYCDIFYNFICSQNQEYIDTMLLNDE